MIVSFSAIAIITKINTKMKIKVVNNIPNNRLKFICVINMPGQLYLLYLQDNYSYPPSIYT